jgi:hypothetical protein
VHIDAQQKERRMKWHIALHVNAVMLYPSLTYLRAQRTVSALGPAHWTVALLLYGHLVPTIDLLTHNSNDRCHIALWPLRPQDRPPHARQPCPSEHITPCV